MVEISATLVKELREATNVGMMECKKALQEAGGDKDKAIKILRERGLAIAGKKAGRAVNSGVIAAQVAADGASGVMIEVNCETDFVARNEVFRAFVKQLLAKAQTTAGELAPQAQAELAAKIAEIGENMMVRRNVRFDRQGAGRVAAYIHTGDKVGVLIEVGADQDAAAARPEFAELVKDLTLHIAAAHPQYLDRKAVPAALVAGEREIYAKQVEGKPANIVEKIVGGKLEKFYAQVCLVEQAFVKNPDVTVTQLVAEAGKKVGAPITIRRFARFQLGEDIG